jgi:hypothetical protein
LAAVAAIYGNRIGGYLADHVIGVGDGFGQQFDSAFCIFFIRRLVNKVEVGFQNL